VDDYMAQLNGDVQDPVRLLAIKEIGHSIFDRYGNRVQVMVPCCGPGNAANRLAYGCQ